MNIYISTAAIFIAGFFLLIIGYCSGFKAGLIDKQEKDDDYLEEDYSFDEDVL